MGAVQGGISPAIHKLQKKLGLGVRVAQSDGHLGMVTQLQFDETGQVTMDVRWDVGSLDKYVQCNNVDLRVYDTSAAFGVHVYFQCAACGDGPIQGLRWSCTLCNSYSLCSACYHGDAHDLSHPFDCYICSTPKLLESIEVRTPTLPARQSSHKVDLVGALPGATVVRGPDWNSDMQDGGEGQTGTVIDFDQYKAAMRASLKVHWHATNEVNSCRMSRKAELKVVQPSPSRTSVYLEHLPRFDFVYFRPIKDKYEFLVSELRASLTYTPEDEDDESESDDESSEEEAELRRSTKKSKTQPADSVVAQYNVGDFVKVTNSYSKAQRLLNGPGPKWNTDLNEVLGCYGKVLGGENKCGQLPVNFGHVTALLQPRLLSRATVPDDKVFIYDYVQVKSKAMLLSAHWELGKPFDPDHEKICDKFGRVVKFGKKSDNLIVLLNGKLHTLKTNAVKRCETQPHMLTLGDVVRVSQDAETVRMLQGDDANDGVKYLGKTGRVVHLDQCGDALLRIGDQIVKFNPAVLTKVQSAAQAGPLSQDVFTIESLNGKEIASTRKFVIAYEQFYQLKATIAQLDTKPGQVASDETPPNRSALVASASSGNAFSERKGTSVVFVNQSSFTRSISGLAASDEVSRLKTKLDYLEDQVACKVCTSKRKEVAFQCGHGACKSCAKQIEQCHVCCAVIEKRTVLY